MNGIPHQPGNPLVTLVEQVLKMVKSGEITTVCIIGVNDTGGLMRPFGGTRLADLYTGCGLVQDDIKDIMKRPPASPIVRASVIPPLQV